MLAILALSILVRIVFLEFYWIDTNAAWDDEPVYISVAEYIRSGNSWISKDAPSTRPILLSVLISPLVELSNHTINIVQGFFYIFASKKYPSYHYTQKSSTHLE